MKSAILLTLAATATAGPLLATIDRTHVRMESSVPSYNQATSSWISTPFDKSITTKQLTVALKVDPKARAKLESIFWEVSDPEHANYGNHLTLEELAAVMAVPSSRVEKVVQYFKTNGATKVVVSPTNDKLSITIPITKLETALRTTIGKFTHKDNAKVNVLRASTAYSLPEDIAKEVDMVGELLQFPALRRKDLTNLQGSGTWPNSCSSQSTCSGLVQPEVIRQRYNLPNQTEYEKLLGGYVNAQANSMAVAEFQGQYFEPTDLASFSKACNRKVEVDTVTGGNKNSAGVEAELDIEYVSFLSFLIWLCYLCSAIKLYLLTPFFFSFFFLFSSFLLCFFLLFFYFFYISNLYHLKFL